MSAAIATPAPTSAVEDVKRQWLNYTVVTTQPQLASAIAEIMETDGPVAVDFETARVSDRASYDPLHGRLRLIQLAVVGAGGPRQWVVDCDRVDPIAVQALLADPAKEKLIFYCHFEAAWARVHLNCQIRNIYDPCVSFKVAQQRLGAILRDPQLGPPVVDRVLPGWREQLPADLQTVTRVLLGVELAKGMQESDWATAELTCEQLDCAALDAAVLHPLAQRTRKLDRLLCTDARVAGMVTMLRWYVQRDWPQERIDREDGSREFCWRVAYAQTEAELDALAAELPMTSIARYNRERLAWVIDWQRRQLTSATPAAADPGGSFRAPARQPSAASGGLLPCAAT